MPEESDDTRDDGEVLWQTEAKRAIENAMASARFDKGSKTIFVPAEHESGRTYEEEFTDSAVLWTYLEQLGEEAWHGSVPYDGGEPVFEPDVEDYLMDIFNRYKVEKFFAR